MNPLFKRAYSSNNVEYDCNKEHPRKDAICHPDAKELLESDEGDIKYECPNCGSVFWEEGIDA